ncbi:MAG: glycosyltransferase [Sandaracinaceae bacterium]
MSSLPNSSSVRGALTVPKTGRLVATDGRVRLDGYVASRGAAPIGARLVLHGHGTFEAREALRGNDGGAARFWFETWVVLGKRVRELDVEVWATLADGTRAFASGAHVPVDHADGPAWTQLALAGGQIIRGALDAPTAKTPIEADAPLTVSGWVVAEPVPVLRAWIARGAEDVPLTLGVARPDVASAMKTVVPGSDRAGFRATLPAPSADEVAHGHVDLEYWVELASGAIVRWMSLRSPVSASMLESGPLAQRALQISGAARAQRDQARARIAALGWGRGPAPGDQDDRDLATLETADPAEPSPRQGRPPDEVARALAYARWCETNHLTPQLRARITDATRVRAEAEATLGLLLPLRDAAADRALGAIESVRAQLHRRWTLHVLDDGTSGAYLSRALARLAEDDRRIRIHGAPIREAPIHEAPIHEAPIHEAPVAGAAAAQHLLRSSMEDVVALIDPDDRLAPHALSHVAMRLARIPDLEILTCDEDHLDRAGTRSAPDFKHPFCPSLLFARDAVGRLGFVRRSTAIAAGGYDAASGDAHAYDLWLRLSEGVSRARIDHVADVLCHRLAPRGPSSSGPSDAALDAVRRALARRGHGEVATPRAHPRVPGAIEVVWSDEVLARVPTTIVIPTRERVDLLERCIESLRRTVPADALRVIVVDDRSEEPATLAYLRDLASDPRVRVVRPTAPRDGFDFASLINFGAEHVDTPAMLVLNNDACAIAPGWLARMVGHLGERHVGAVGALLFSPDGTIDHAGVAVGPHGGLADHLMRRAPVGAGGPGGIAHLTREVSAVTGACLLTYTALYRELGGFDAERFRVDYNDIDYCLRLRRAGYRVLMAPGAELEHVGAASRGRGSDEREQIAFVDEHRALRDPALDPNYAVDGLRYEIDPYRVASRPLAPPRLRIAICSSLADDDAGSELSDLCALHLAHSPELALVRVRERFAIEDDTVPSFRERIRRRIDLASLSGIDAVLAHGSGGLFGIELARQLGCPSVAYLNLRGGPAEVAAELGGSPAAHELVHRALAAATRVVLPSVHSVPGFVSDGWSHRFVALPIGASRGRLDAFRRTHDMRELRARHGCADADRVIVYEGPDDGPLAHAAHVALRSVRGRPIVYRARGRKAYPIERAGPPADLLDAIAMCDLVVTSDGGPRVFGRALLSAMAFGVAVIGPGLPGVGEVVGHPDDGTLVDTAHAGELGAAIQRCVDDPDHTASVGRKNRSMFVRHFDTDRLVGRHRDVLLDAVMTG